MDPNLTMFQNQGDPTQYVAGSSAEHPPATFNYSTMDVQHGYEQVVLNLVVDSVVSLASYFMHDSYIEVMLFCSWTCRGTMTLTNHIMSSFKPFWRINKALCSRTKPLVKRSIQGMMMWWKFSSVRLVRAKVRTLGTPREGSHLVGTRISCYVVPGSM
jgi:hypothetical protein